MKKIKQWILMEPLDTLFFKGLEPMIAGESHEVRSIFPPMPSTLCGALRTGVMLQRGIDPRVFSATDGSNPEIRRNFPLLGMPAEPGFEIVGPVFLVQNGRNGGDWLFPAPANWLGPKPDRRQGGKQSDTVRISMGQPLAACQAGLGLCGSVSNPLWASNPKDRDVVSLAGLWVNGAALEACSSGRGTLKMITEPDKFKSGDPTIVKLSALFEHEVRVGIALERDNRKVRPGHLYSSTHVRLADGVGLVVGLSEALVPSYLDKTGIVQLGGEQRVVRHELLPEGPNVPGGGSPWLMSLSPVPYEDIKKHGWEELPRASGPLIRMGGWNMKEQFHKPVTAYFPPGTVIMAGHDRPAPFGFIRI
jgi:CRISPR-associated protein Cmr3